LRKLPFVQTAVFVDKRYDFTGNQLATFWNSEANQGLTDEEMQGITREMNYAETTFVFKSKRKDCISKVRVFTPVHEILFAGLPALGTAYALRRQKIVDAKTTDIRLELRIGPINVEFLGKQTISMKQKAPEFLGEMEDPRRVMKAISLPEKSIDEDYPIGFVSTGNPFLIVPLKSLSSVQRASPKSSLILNALEGAASQDVLIFSTDTVHADANAHARVFAPSANVPEDPATGSAIGPLGAYIEQHDVISSHERGDVIVVEQGYEMNRPSQLRVQLIRKKQKTDVLVSGGIRTIAEGMFYLK
jgi:trans-2,3-dihydro-3-hydroxyanthranilate isomerase